VQSALICANMRTSALFSPRTAFVRQVCVLNSAHTTTTLFIHRGRRGDALRGDGAKFFASGWVQATRSFSAHQVLRVRAGTRRSSFVNAVFRPPFLFAHLSAPRKRGDGRSSFASGGVQPRRSFRAPSAPATGDAEKEESKPEC